MSEVFENFDISSKISNKLKQNIVIFNAFDDEKGYNFLFVTSDDNVYSIGQNTFGSCGSGHNSPVDVPQIVTQLCGKGIKSFHNGWDFVVGLSADNQIYSWGRNSTGQLARGYLSKENEFFRPEIVVKPNDMKIIGISCGGNHVLVLTSDGRVFGWGSNKYGEQGCPKETEYIALAKNVNLNMLIKSVYCAVCTSFALTNNGLVYSWGQNMWCTLGHNIDNNESLFEPKLINVWNVKSVCNSITNTYFLTNEGLIYFCGVFKDTDNKNTEQRIPKRIDTQTKFMSLHTTCLYQKVYQIATALSKTNVHLLIFNLIHKTYHKNLFDFYSREHKLTVKTIDLRVDNNSNKVTELSKSVESFDNFELFSVVPEETKLTIARFHVFNDKSGDNVLFITSDDKVYGLGHNSNGCLGLGHNNTVEKFQLIHDLCDKNIEEFFIGTDFVLALDNSYHVYGWGCNNSGQLARGYISNDLDVLKPEIISFFENQKVIQLSLGFRHCLALTSDGIVYGWGDNSVGQIDRTDEKNITKPVQLVTLSELIIKNINCFGNQLFVLTTSGLVYIWSSVPQVNNLCPKLISDLNNVRQVCCSEDNTYFLTNDGLIYYFPRIYRNVKNSDSSKLLFVLSDTKFISLCSVMDPKNLKTITVTVSDGCVHQLIDTELIKTNYKTIFDYFSLEHRITPKTIGFEFKDIFEEQSEMDLNFDDKSEIFARFKVSQLKTLTDIIEESKIVIKYFHIFDDTFGYNVIFVTEEDLVFSLGQNTFGGCGLCHNCVVNEPTIVSELCGKNISEFFIGMNTYLALNENRQTVYQWGLDLNSGQPSAPQLIFSAENETVSQISIGALHWLLLTSGDDLYGCGSNILGQVGCGQLPVQTIVKPFKLLNCFDSKIKQILCSYNRSIALTFNGQVYYWGQDNCCLTGEEVDNQFVPKLMENISNVESVCLSSRNMYFLISGQLYYNGISFISENKQEMFQDVPVPIVTKIKFNSLNSMNHYKPINTIGTGITDNNAVYILEWNQIKKTKYNSLFDFYSNDYKVCPQTREHKVVPPEDSMSDEDQISSDLDKFQISFDNICSKISEDFKHRIKLFHIFDDFEGYNVLFITSDDRVYGFGRNFMGSSGLGHNLVVKTPSLIPELCRKNIKEFSIGSTFVLALNCDGNVFGWGLNQLGILHKDYKDNENLNIYFKPKLIPLPENQTAVQISCGGYHYLVLTSNGLVYGWGNNKLGQVGCGKECGGSLPVPILLVSLSNRVIRTIACSYFQSFALDDNGTVYTWGRNNYCVLGYDVEENDHVYLPQPVSRLNNIMAVCPSDFNTYFLSKDGTLYYCGQIEINKVKSLQILPKSFPSIKLTMISSVFILQRREIVSIGVSDQWVYILSRNSIQKTNYRTVYDFFSDKYSVTHKTICANRYYYFNKYILDKFDNDHRDHIRSKYKNYFIELCHLGSGTFGQVFKVKNKIDHLEYAVKKIYLQGSIDDEKAKLEVLALTKKKSDFVVNYFDSWFENNFLFIQMELCSDSLKTLIQQKPGFFDRKPMDPMNSIEYFICCHLFEELLECVQYLHESDPPIIHRDLKPDNILIKNTAVCHRFLKLGDLGLAVEDDVKNQLKTRGKGTLRYMAPEVAKGKSSQVKYGIKADIYSLGIIAGELFDYDINMTENFNEIIELKENWNELDKILTQMQSRYPKDRPTASEILSNKSNWFNNLGKDDFGFNFIEKKNYCLYNFVEKKILINFPLEGSSYSSKSDNQ